MFPYIYPHYKKLAHMSIEADKSQNLQSEYNYTKRAAADVVPAWDPGKTDVSAWVQRQEKIDVPAEGSQGGGIPSYLGVSQSFILFGPSTEWMKSTHAREGNLPYSVYWFKF